MENDNAPKKLMAQPTYVRLAGDLHLRLEVTTHGVRSSRGLPERRPDQGQAILPLGGE